MKLAVLLTFLLAAPALAQDASEPAPTAEEDRSSWTAYRWFQEFYDRKSAGDASGLAVLLDNALNAPELTPELAQSISGEAAYLAKAEGRLEDAARLFSSGVDGPDEDAAERYRSERDIARDQILQEGRDRCEAGLFEEAIARFDVAADLGADPDVIATEMEKVEERRQMIAEGRTPDPGHAKVPSWGKPPSPSEALTDPVPPPLTEEDWLADFQELKDDEADIEELEEILDELADEEEPAWTQRIAIERGYLGIDAGDKLAAGRAFLEAFDGPDEGLTTRADAELRKLQRHFRLLAVQYTHQGDIARADRAFQTAAALGADNQLMAYERSYIAGLDGDEEKVLVLLEEASEGPNEAVGNQAALELAARTGAGGATTAAAIPHMKAYVEHRDAERWDEADAELDLAEEKGADSQVIELYRAYLDKLKKDDFAARKHFRNVAQGEDKELAKQARSELRYTAKPVWGDLYGEGFGWARLLPEESRFDDFVGLLRVRGYLHPFPKLGFDPYIFAQVSGDVKSRQNGGSAFGGGPLIYADNTVMLGGGLLLRFWKNRISLWGQVGAAFPWVKLSSDPVVQLDVQVGGAIQFATKGCRPADGQPVDAPLVWCAEFYGDTVYRNRPYHNVFFTARGRIGLHYLVTGPVAWSPVAELRFSKDVLNDYWANLIDVGIMHRWRLMGPVGIDLLVGVHGGTLFGVERLDPAPEVLGYLDLRLQIAGYVSF